MKLGFMTFVCPEYELEAIPRFARRAGYDGVEIRVDAGHRHGLSSKSSYEDRVYARRLFEREGIEICSVATSVKLAQLDEDKWQAQVKQAKADIKLAAHLGADVVRIFAGGDSGEMTPELAQVVADAYTELGDYAEPDWVCPMLETGHDIVKGKEEALLVIERVRTPNFGILWNQAGLERDFYDALKDYIVHFHVHDDVLDENNTSVREMAGMMKEIDYNGYVSLEIIRGENMSEDELIQTARRLNAQIAEA